MKIDNTLRKQLKSLLPKNYRQVIVERLEARKITVHPNTVKNVLDGNDNHEVAIELLKLGNEMKASKKASQKQFDDLVKQLSPQKAA